MRRRLVPLGLFAAQLLAVAALAGAPRPAWAQAAEPAFPADSLALPSPSSPAPAAAPSSVRAPVFLDGILVYWSTGADSAAAQVAADSVYAELLACRSRLWYPEQLTLVETDSSAVLGLDTLVVLVLGPANRVDAGRSPLANAWALRRQLVLPFVAAGSRSEEELALRLFLGIVFPLLLLVVLRSTRYGLHRWERHWRRWLRARLEALAARRRLELAPGRIHGFIRALTGVERLLVYGFVAALVAFLWFALFPETRPLALTLLNRGLGPLADLLSATARGLLTLLYMVLVLGLTLIADRRLFGRWRSRPRASQGDAGLHLPLRGGLWLLAIFLMLFPYAGAPRLFALSLLVLAVLIGLIALRPVGEEIAAGLYLHAAHALRRGDRLQLAEAGEPAEILHFGLAQVHLRTAAGDEWLPYSRLLKARLVIHRGEERGS
jgi:hypothetical protein